MSEAITLRALFWSIDKVFISIGITKRVGGFRERITGRALYVFGLLDDSRQEIISSAKQGCSCQRGLWYPI